ncbi:hypothetical protein M3Y96_01040300 [Aphelenchoides besseyi]|nr:hypothetical protein M3Y96_01040300 [Aphelenchoides besseyi]
MKPQGSAKKSKGQKSSTMRFTCQGQTDESSVELPVASNSIRRVAHGHRPSGQDRGLSATKKSARGRSSSVGSTTSMSSCSTTPSQKQSTVNRHFSNRAATNSAVEKRQRRSSIDSEARGLRASQRKRRLDSQAAGGRSLNRWPANMDLHSERQIDLVGRSRRSSSNYSVASSRSQSSSAPSSLDGRPAKKPKEADGHQMRIVLNVGGLELPLTFEFDSKDFNELSGPLSIKSVSFDDQQIFAHSSIILKKHKPTTAPLPRFGNSTRKSSIKRVQ